MNYTRPQKMTKFYTYHPSFVAGIVAWIQIFLNVLTALLIILTLVRVITVPKEIQDGNKIDGKERTIFVFRVLICFVSMGMAIILLVGSLKDRLRRSYLTTYVIFGLVLFLWDVFIATFGAGHVVLRIVQFAQLPVYAVGIATAAALVS